MSYLLEEKLAAEALSEEEKAERKVKRNKILKRIGIGAGIATGAAALTGGGYALNKHLKNRVAGSDIHGKTSRNIPVSENRNVLKFRLTVNEISHPDDKTLYPYEILDKNGKKIFSSSNSYSQPQSFSSPFTSPAFNLDHKFEDMTKRKDNLLKLKRKK